MDDRRGGKDAGHRVAVHPHRRDQDPDRGTRAAPDPPARRELRRAAPGSPPRGHAAGPDPGGAAVRDPTTVPAVRARAARAQPGGAGRGARAGGYDGDQGGYRAGDSLTVLRRYNGVLQSPERLVLPHDKKQLVDGLRHRAARERDADRLEDLPRG